MELFKQIEQLAKKSCRTEVPPLDVVDQVCRTIRLHREEEPRLLDTPSIAFAGLSLAVTGVATALFLPLLTTLWDPWTAYMGGPWSF